MDAIVVEDLVKRYGRLTALDGISFTVHRGEFFGFLGPNGAGKTTTVRILTGILPPDSGQARINGYDITRDEIAAKGAMGIVPEMANVYIDLTAWGNMMLMGELYGVPRRVRRQRAQQLLTEFGLWERRNDRARTFSKGMRQRLLLAMALVNAPQILFLDEPTTGIDVSSARQIRRLIAGLHSRGTTIFLTTHYIEEAERLCQRIAFIVKGRIVEINTLAELLQPVQQKQAMLISVSNPGDGLWGKLAAAFPDLEFHAVSSDQVHVESARPIGIGPLVRFIESSGAEVMEARRVRVSLEDVFVRITGIELDAMTKEKEKTGGGR